MGVRSGRQLDHSREVHPTVAGLTQPFSQEVYPIDELGGSAVLRGV
jgi:hypothetical protein